MEKKIAHLQMIQAVVNRMSVNSFLLKGWSVVLVSALFALTAGQSKKLFVYLAYFPAIAFWALDGYFLHQERLFRALYDRVRTLEDSQIDFSMDTSVVSSKAGSWAGAAYSMTLLIFHGAVIGTILVVMFFVLPAY